MNLFKSKHRIKIESQAKKYEEQTSRILSRIKFFEDAIKDVQADKEKVIRLPEQYASLWCIEKDYRRNIQLLKELL